jgi:hypothetical protein
LNYALILIDDPSTTKTDSLAVAVVIGGCESSFYSLTATTGSTTDVADSLQTSYSLPEWTTSSPNPAFNTCGTSTETIVVRN